MHTTFDVLVDETVVVGGEGGEGWGRLVEVLWGAVERAAEVPSFRQYGINYCEGAEGGGGEAAVGMWGGRRLSVEEVVEGRTKEEMKMMEAEMWGGKGEGGG